MFGDHHPANNLPDEDIYFLLLSIEDKFVRAEIDRDELTKLICLQK